MDFLITKASNEEWYELKYFDTIQELMNFFDNGKCRLIIDLNHWRDVQHIRKWLPEWAEDAEDIAHCKYELKIYDDYIE